jgi:hypothetical protein
MGWQRRALWRALAVDRRGELVHSLYLASTARQNGKSTFVRILIGWAMTEAPELLEWARIIGLAYDRAQARTIYSAVKGDAERPALEDYYRRITAHRGLESVTGAQYDVLSREAVKTARSLTVDLVLLDEVLLQTSMDLWTAVEPTMTVPSHPLAVGISTAGNPRSVLLRSWWDRGRRVIDGIEDADGFGMSWWAADPAGAEDDPAEIMAANPAVIDRRLSIARILRSRRALTPLEYRRERLNLWSDAAEEWLPAGAWADSVADQPHRNGGRVTLGVEVPPSWRRATVTVALPGSPGSWAGVAWEADASRLPSATVSPELLLEGLAQAAAAWKPAAIAYSNAAAAAPHVAAWARDHDIPTHELGPRDLRQASETFRAELVGGRLGHGDDPLLALQVASSRPSGPISRGDWYLSIRESTGEIDALRAAAWATFALLYPPAPTKSPTLYTPRSRRLRVDGGDRGSDTLTDGEISPEE